MDTELKKFVESDISEDFGLTVDTIAQNCKTYGRFKAWCNSDLTKVKQVLNTVKNNGVSPAFFAAYERGEGYNSKWGWLNHTRPQGDYIEDAKSVSDWIKRQSNIMTSKPSWIDAGHPQFDPVPESVKQEGNEHFKSLKKGSIGRVVIAGTAAATWETYYPPALKKEYNKVQDYGTPLKWMKDAIISWGGTLDTEGGGDEPDEPPEPPEDPEVNNLKDFFGTKLKFIYSNNTNRYFLNKYMNIKKQLDNTYLVSFNYNFINELHEFIKGGYEPPEPPEPPVPPEPPEEPDDRVLPVPKGLKITSKYGWRSDPITGEQRFHDGVDYGGGGKKHPIYSTSAGTVVKVYEENIPGKVIEIKHKNDKYYSRYQHLDSFKVKVGDEVKAGQEIGLMGKTGKSTGIHLHFSITTKTHSWGENVTIDPLKYLGLA